MKTYRQGDILIEEIESLPEGLRQKDNVLAEGETTGHRHEAVGAKVYTDANGMQYLQVEKQARITHQEHKQIQIPKGSYRITRQREYSPQDERQVND